MISRALMEKVISGKRDERVYLCEQEFGAFAMYYFSEFFVYKSPAFHFVMYQDLMDFVQGRFPFLMWLMFRESAKTSLAKIYVIYCIVYRKKRFINWDSYDKENAESALYDIAIWLQTNGKLIADFGQLFYEEVKQKERSSTMKRVAEFITSNNVKVKAYSTQESTRGRIFNKWRPDLYIIDDFETVKTKESVPVTAKIIAHIDELKAGISVDGQVLFLCNYITENGSVALLTAEAKENPVSWRLRRVDIVQDGVIMWPDKYVWTNEQAAEINKSIPDRKEWKISIEQKKKDLNSGGRKIFEMEMMNNPAAAGEMFFDRNFIEKAKESAKKRPALRVVAGFSLWEEYGPKKRYAIGGDTSKGVGRDSCASGAIRFSEMDTKPALLVGAYANNTISPDMFAYELKNQGNMLGECLLAPELNNTGFATVTQLKLIYPQGKIYRQVRKDQLGNVISDDLGWEATSSNVADLYYQFRTAFHDGEIEIFDERVLDEMFRFTNADLKESTRKSESNSMVGATRHFDLLRAVVIAWEMRHHAKPAVKEKKYVQPAFQGRSEYQG